MFVYFGCVLCGAFLGIGGVVFVFCNASGERVNNNDMRDGLLYF